MKNLGAATTTANIFENILFLAEIFGDKSDSEMPNVPVLELARCFNLREPGERKRTPPRSKSWPLWN